MSNFKEKGNEAFRNKNYKEAIEFYDEAIKIEPRNPKYHSNKATSYYNLSDFKNAIICVNTTLSIDPLFMKGIVSKKM